MTRILFTTLGAALAGSLMAAGCGGKEKHSPRAARTVEVELTDAGCDPARMRLPAGPTTFHVTNTGTAKVSEFEVLEGARVLGETENLSDGRDATMSLTLKKGRYELRCPGGDAAAAGELSVSGGVGGSRLSGPEAAAVDRYRRYLERNSASLVGRVETFSDAVRARDVARAKELFAGAREPYEAIEPVAESFGDLDPAIDARINDVDAGLRRWTGFHRLEWALWKRGRLDAADARIARRLVADVKRLVAKVQDVELEPAQIVNGSNELLGEVAKSKITGEEDRYTTPTCGTSSPTSTAHARLSWPPGRCSNAAIPSWAVRSRAASPPPRGRSTGTARAWAS